MKPITRVELRFMKGPPRSIKLVDLVRWIKDDSKAFSDLRFAECLSARFDLPMQKLKADYFERLVRDDGYSLAVKKITSQFKKAKRTSAFGAVIGAWETRKKYALDRRFQKNLSVFASTPLDPAEEAMLAKLKRGLETPDRG